VNTTDDEETTDVDHMDRSLAVTYRSKPAPQQFKNKGTYVQQYDREGKPICFYCGFRGHRHESKDCFHKKELKKGGKKQALSNRASVQQVDITTDNAEEAEFSVCLTKVANTKFTKPMVNIKINNISVSALIDTGSDLTIMNVDIFCRI
jgi:hypothetical protein